MSGRSSCCRAGRRSRRASINSESRDILFNADTFPASSDPQLSADIWMKKSSEKEGPLDFCQFRKGQLPTESKFPLANCLIGCGLWD